MYFFDEKSITPLRPIHMVQFVAYNSFLLLYSNHRDYLRISEYDRSCVQVIISCEWVFIGSCDLSKFGINYSFQYVVW